MGKMKQFSLEKELDNLNISLNHTNYELDLLIKRKNKIETIAKNLLNAFDKYRGKSDYNDKMINRYKKECIEYFRTNEL